MKFIEQKAWIAENFPRDRRYENLILESENILTADTVRYVSAMHRSSTITKQLKGLFSLQSWTKGSEITSLRIT